jgi:hypothetical protein
MDLKELRGLMEAYSEVYTPVDEATAMAKRGLDEPAIRQQIAKTTGGGEAADRASALEKQPTYGNANKAKARQELARKQRGDFRNTTSSNPGLHGYAHKSNDPEVKAKQAARGTQRGVLTPAERARLNREELEQVDEAITSEKGKAKAAEMIANRSTPSGRAKSGQGASVAAIKHISRANVDNLGGTPPNLKIAKNPVKSRSYGGTGNKAARRAAALKNEEVDIFDVVLEFLQVEGFAETLEDAEWMMANVIDEEAIDIILGEDAGIISGLAGLALGAKGGAYAAKHTKRMRDYPKNFVKGMIDPRTYVPQKKKEQKEEFVDEAQAARENPEKYEREQSKKYAPVRGEKTPMPPRGDKRREDFEKWYAKQMGR